MNRNEMAEKLSALMQDESFQGKLENAEDLDEVAACFRAEGIQITAEELATAMNRAGCGELNEDELENVSGGSYMSFLLWIQTKRGQFRGNLKRQYEEWLSKQGIGNWGK